MATSQDINPKPQPVTSPALDPAFTQALLAALGKNKSLETLQYLNDSGLTRNIQNSPRNLGGSLNPTLQQMTDGPNPFFRSEAGRQARIAESPVSQVPSLLSSSSPTFNSRFGGPGVRPTPTPALGSAENPFISPDGRRTVVLPNGSLGSGGGGGNLPFEQGEFRMNGNEDLAPFMERPGNGIYGDPRQAGGALMQAGAMDAQGLRQGQIQQQLRNNLNTQPQRSGLEPAQLPGASGYSLDDLANGPQSGGVARQETPPWARLLQKGGSGAVAPGKGGSVAPANAGAPAQPAQIPGQFIPGQSDSQIPLIRNVYNAGEGAMGGLAWLADMINQGVTNPIAQQLGLPGYAPTGNRDWMKQQWAAPDPQDWMTFFFGN